MLCSFFKNLCEHNCLDFKNYLGSFVPKVQDKSWNEENHTCMQIFSSQLQFLMDASNLAENRNTVMVHSDQHERIQPLLLPLVILLNELVTGPCLVNQKTLMKQPLLQVFQIMSRILDDLSHPFYQLKQAALQLIISLTEGFRKKAMREISIRATPSII